MNNTYYEFRAPKSIDEMKKLLQLRCKIYKDCRLVDFVDDNQSGYDLDAYDARAYQMGLFMHSDDGCKLIGTHREIIDGVGPHAEWIEQIESELNIHLPNGIDFSDKPFPAFSYDSSAVDVLEQFYSKAKDEHKTVGEASRYALDPSIRSLSLAKFLVEAIIAVFVIAKSIKYGIMWVHLSHAPFYERYGFKKIDGIDEVVAHDLPGCFMVLQFDTIPMHLLDRLYKIAEAYRTTGSICYNPSNPDNYYPPEPEPCEGLGSVQTQEPFARLAM